MPQHAGDQHRGALREGFRDVFGGLAPDRIDKQMAARMRRACRLTDTEAPLDYATVAAFRRALGEAEIGPVQLAHVIELARRPNVTLHVLPLGYEK